MGVKNYKNIVLMLLSSFFILPNIASAENFPRGCTKDGYSFQNQMLILKPTRLRVAQTLYFIHNISDHAVNLMQVRTGDEPYVMYTNNQLKSNLWNALATNEKVMMFQCTAPAQGKLHSRFVDCSQVLNICEFTRTTFAVNNHGTYWAVSNRTRGSAISSVIRQGVLLRWRKGIES